MRLNIALRRYAGESLLASRIVPPGWDSCNGLVRREAPAQQNGPKAGCPAPGLRVSLAVRVSGSRQHLGADVELDLPLLLQVGQDLQRPGDLAGLVRPQPDRQDVDRLAVRGAIAHR